MVTLPRMAWFMTPFGPQSVIEPANIHEFRRRDYLELTDQQAADYFAGVVEIPDVSFVTGQELAAAMAAAAADTSSAFSAAQRAAFVASTDVRSIVALTPTESALTTKDPNTLYLIRGTPLTSALVDSFDSVNPSLWTSTGTTSITGGNLEITPAYSADATGYAGYKSVKTYDLRFSTLEVHVAAIPNDAYTSDLSLLFGTEQSHDSLEMTWEDNNLLMRAYNGATRTTVAAPPAWDFTAMAWWRFRHDGTTIFWETSPDRVSWTTRGSIAASSLTWDPSAGYVMLRCGYYDTVSVPTRAGKFAGVNA